MNFDCPHCGRAQTVTSADLSSGGIHFATTETALGRLGLRGSAICCANLECLQATIDVQVQEWTYVNGNMRWVETKPVLQQRLIPESSAKPQPNYIPDPIREDYLEACRIKDLSPKASATLARRCLQGMIRDFAGIQEPNLFREINKLKELSDAGNEPKGVSGDSIESLHHVRSLGNIGAHMEKDIDLIIPVDPDEAQIMLDLIEILFDEWYVAREKRQSRFAAIRVAAEEKQALRNRQEDAAPE